jgi:hypothetical protein
MTLSPLPEALAPLAALPNWVVWRWETAKNGKPTKVPYQPNRPQAKARNNAASTWGDYETARQTSERGKADGVGFCLLGTEFAAFDLDNCRNAANGEIAIWAQKLVERVGSYTEVTVSGTGLRIIGRGTGPKVHKKQRTEGEGSLETYRKAERYIVMTGQVLPGTAPLLANIDAHVDAIVAELDAKKKMNGAASPRGRRPSGAPSRPADDVNDIIRNGCGDRYGGDRSRAVWRVVNELVRQGRAPDEIRAILLDRANGISQHVYDQANPGEYVAQQVRKAVAEKPNRPLVRVRKGEIARIVRETENALVAANRPIFNRAGTLVEPIFTKLPTTDGGKTDVTVLRPMGIDRPSIKFRVRLGAS